MSADYVGTALEYAQAVVKGKIVACKWVKLACKKHLDDLKASRRKAFPYYFDEDAANKVCTFLSLMPHTKGRWAQKRELIVLRPWQCFAFTTLFGWKIKKNDLRRYRKAYFAVPRKNGKSIIGSGIGLYMFSVDGEFGAEVYSGATTEKQAWEVFRPAKQMIERTPQLQEALGAEVWAKALIVPADGSRFEPVVGKPGDGASPSCAIVDEYHEHDTSELVDTMETGMGAREQPLLLMITTAGFNIAGPCYEQEVEAKKMLEGTLDDPELFALIYTIDEKDDWTKPDALRKANPNFGVSVGEDFLLAQQRQAIQSARKQVRFKTKYLNVWCSAKSAWLNMLEWAKCADLTLRREQFKGERCYLTLDLASRSDVCVLMLIFVKVIDGKQHFYLFGDYYLPEAAIESAEKNSGAYQKWVIEGFLQQHDGAEIDFDLIEEDMLALVGEYGPDEVVFDPYRAAQLEQRLTKRNITAVELGQTVKNLSLPMKEFESAIKAGRVHHDGNPMLTWMMSNVVAKTDAKDNIYPRKAKDEQKIDGAVASIMGIARAISGEEVATSFWDKD
jgi:phage terminase large subunit-like protein